MAHEVSSFLRSPPGGLSLETHPSSIGSRHETSCDSRVEAAAQACLAARNAPENRAEKDSALVQSLKMKSSDPKAEDEAAFDAAFAALQKREFPVPEGDATYLIKYYSKMKRPEKVEAVINLCSEKGVQKSKTGLQGDFMTGGAFSQLISDKDLKNLLSIFALMRKVDFWIDVDGWISLLGLAASSGDEKIWEALTQTENPNAIRFFLPPWQRGAGLLTIIAHGPDVFEKVVEFLKNKKIFIPLDSWSDVRLHVSAFVKKPEVRARFNEAIEQHRFSPCCAIL